MTELDVVGSAHLVGHSLGGMVVTAVGAAAPVASIVNVDQSLQLAGFKAQLGEFEPMLRDADTFGQVIDGLFALLAGSMIAADEMSRVNDLRRPDQSVVLGVWDLVFSLSEAELEAVVEQALAGYASTRVRYLSLFGVDPGPGYDAWLSSFITDSVTELWPEHGHYPHLVDPDRFVDRLRTFWA